MMKPVQPTGLVEGKAYLPLGKWFIIKAGCMIYRCRFRFASDDTTYSQFLLNFEDEDELQMEMRVGLAALVNSNFHLTRMLTSNLEMIVVIRKPCPKVAAKAFRWQKPDHHGSLVSVQFVLQISHRTTTGQIKHSVPAMPQKLASDSAPVVRMFDDDPIKANSSGSSDLTANSTMMVDHGEKKFRKGFCEITAAMESSRRRIAETMSSLRMNELISTASTFHMRPTDTHKSCEIPILFYPGYPCCSTLDREQCKLRLR